MASPKLGRVTHPNQYSLCVSQHMHKTKNNMWVFELIGHRRCKGLMKVKTPLLQSFECFYMHVKGFRTEVIIWVRYYLNLNEYVTSEGAVSHNVSYYQYLSIARNQVSLHSANSMLTSYQYCPVPVTWTKMQMFLSFLKSFSFKDTVFGVILFQSA